MQTSKLALASLFLGIISVFSWWLLFVDNLPKEFGVIPSYLTISGIIFGITVVIYAKINKNLEGIQCAHWGISLSILSVPMFWTLAMLIGASHGAFIH